MLFGKFKGFVALSALVKGERSLGSVFPRLDEPERIPTKTLRALSQQSRLQRFRQYRRGPIVTLVVLACNHPHVSQPTIRQGTSGGHAVRYWGRIGGCHKLGSGIHGTNSNTEVPGPQHREINRSVVRNGSRTTSAISVEHSTFGFNAWPSPLTTDHSPTDHWTYQRLKLF